MAATRFDLLVFGAGHAGLAFAIEAARGGARVVVVDRARRWPKIGEVVEAAVQAPLARLGVWDAFMQQGHLRSTGTLSAWAEHDPEARSSIVNPFGGGWFVERERFDELLMGAGRAAGVQIRISSGRAYKFAHGFLATTDTGEVSAPLAIEATGRHGAAIAPPERRTQDDLVAVCAYPAASALDLQFRLETVDEGWWYAAPLPNGRSVVALMTLIRLLPREVRRRQEFWYRSLASTRLIAPFVLDASAVPAVYPASGRIRRTLHEDRWLAVGDAAAAYDPLHGLGIVAALTKGIAAAALLTRGHTIRAAFELYEETERSSFEAYDWMRRRIYAEGAVARAHAVFWQAMSREREPPRPH